MPWPCPVYRLQGPPGTGKTYTLTNQWIPRAVALHGPESVLVCSLTRAAASEIGGRADLPRQNVSTLHAFAYRALDKPPLAQDKKNIQSWNARVRPDWEITGTSKPGSADGLEFNDGRGKDGDKLLDVATMLRNKMVDPDEWPVDARNFWNEWLAWKRKHQYLDFTDLIEKPAEFNTPPPAGTKVIVCDEAQDFTYLDMTLIRHWAQWCEMVVMAGDRNQALFTWIGANPKAFIPDELPDEEITNLGQSYRVPERVRRYATRWLDQDSSCRQFPYASRRDEKGEVIEGSVAYMPGVTMEHPQRLVEDVIRQVERGNRVMLLASCRFLLNRVTKRLKQDGVPFWNPYRLKEGGWNPMRGGPTRLVAFLRPFRPEVGERGPWTWAEVKRWTEPLRAKGTFRHGAMGEIHFRATKDPDGEATDEVIRTLFDAEAYESLCEAMESEGLSDALDWFESRLLASGKAMMGMAIPVARQRGAKALVDQPQVIVGSFHSVKGGDSDVVYISPDLGGAAAREWNNLGNPEGRDAIVRAFYVGLTRARKAVALLGPGSKNRIKWIPTEEE